MFKIIRIDTNCDFPNFVLEILLQCDKEIFRFINILLTILSSVPVSVVTMERNFSS